MSKQAVKPGANAKVHTHQSNRKARDASECKTVFKNALDNPFQIKWPQIPVNLENAILAQVVRLLQGVAEYNLAKRSAARSNRRHGQKKSAKLKDIEMKDAYNKSSEGDPVPRLDTAKASSKRKEGPAILQATSVGINDVTKRLEAQSQAAFNPSSEIIAVEQNSTSDVSDSPTTKGPISRRSRVHAVLVCKADIDPPMLVNHIPFLVASCNSRVSSNGIPVRLVTLPKGSELSLAQAFGVRRAAVVALDEDATNDPALRSLLESVSLVVAPWVVGPLPVPRNLKGTQDARPKLPLNHKDLLPTQIKQIRTTMPKDMKKHKAKRAKERAEAKKRRKERMKKDANDKAVVSTAVAEVKTS